MTYNQLLNNHSKLQWAQLSCHTHNHMATFAFMTGCNVLHSCYCILQNVLPVPSKTCPEKVCTSDCSAHVTTPVIHLMTTAKKVMSLHTTIITCNQKSGPSYSHKPRSICNHQCSMSNVKYEYLWCD